MNDRPIGVFDSGLGGLTCVRELMRVMPHEDIIYLGDTGRVPYGTRSNETIIKYALQDIAFLSAFDVKSIVIACGTVSSVALDHISREGLCPITGVVEAAADAAVKATKSGRIGVLGTPATVASGAYGAKLKAKLPGVSVVGRACPLFVPLVENGYIADDNEVLRLVAQEYLAPVLKENVDTIILGCTHYPLIRGAIAKLCPGVTLIDSGREAALAAAHTARKSKTECSDKTPTYRFFVTDACDNFDRIGSMFLEQPMPGKVERVELK